VPLSEVEGAAEHYDTERQGTLELIAKLKRINLRANAPKMSGGKHPLTSRRLSSF
jgi:hypothetical protein